MAMAAPAAVARYQPEWPAAVKAPARMRSAWVASGVGIGTPQACAGAGMCDGGPGRRGQPECANGLSKVVTKLAGGDRADDGHAEHGAKLT